MRRRQIWPHSCLASCHFDIKWKRKGAFYLHLSFFKRPNNYHIWSSCRRGASYFPHLSTRLKNRKLVKWFKSAPGCPNHLFFLIIYKPYFELQVFGDRTDSSNLIATSIHWADHEDCNWVNKILNLSLKSYTNLWLLNEEQSVFQFRLLPQ